MGYGYPRGQFGFVVGHQPEERCDLVEVGSPPDCVSVRIPRKIASLGEFGQMHVMQVRANLGEGGVIDDVRVAVGAPGGNPRGEAVEGEWSLLLVEVIQDVPTNGVCQYTETIGYRLG